MRLPKEWDDWKELGDFDRGVQHGKEIAADIAECDGYFATARKILSGGDESKIDALLADRQRLVRAPTEAMATAMCAVVAERERQEQKFPGEVLPDGTGGEFAAKLCAIVRQWCDEANGTRENSYALVLVEEVLEVLAESEPGKLGEDVRQCAAVCVKWLESIEQRSGR